MRRLLNIPPIPTGADLPTNPSPNNPQNPNAYALPRSSMPNMNIPRMPFQGLPGMGMNHPPRFAPVHSFMPPPSATCSNETNQLLTMLIQKLDSGFADMRTMQERSSNGKAASDGPVSQPPSSTSSMHNPTGIPTCSSATTVTSPSHASSFPPGSSNHHEDYVRRLENKVTSLTDQIGTLTGGLNSLSFNPPNEHRQAPYSNYRIHPSKWNIHFGDKGKLPIDSFLFQIRTLKESNVADWESVLGCFHLFLEGNPLTWYWDWRSTVFEEFTWLVLSAALLKNIELGKLMTKFGFRWPKENKARRRDLCTFMRPL